ncbi:MAG: tyrosine-type recombinase/integrase [Leptospirales bacterium]
MAKGLRKANVLGLEWSQVDLPRQIAWIHPDQPKRKKAIGVPLSMETTTVLRKQEENHPRFVFTFEGTPIRQVNTKAWRVP